MANQLNIKSEDGYRLATELSVLTGESLTSAVTGALRERLERERRLRDRAARLRLLTSLAAEIRASLRSDCGPTEALGTSLYDESGRPR
jgi:antitoxin VapB